MIEDMGKYLEPKDPDGIESVRESVLGQFGPDYCVIATNAAFRMLVSYFLIDRVPVMSPTATEMLARLHGGIIKGAVLGAGFDGDDACKIIAALRKDALDD